MKPADVKCVAVIGAGTMGAGIAGEFARAGCRVRLLDMNDELLARGMELAERAQGALVKGGVLGAKEAAGALKRISTTTVLEEACEGVQLLVEAIAENLPLKREMFRRFDEYCPRGAVLASNTSGLSISKMAAVTGRPGLVAGMHFWNPPHLIPLVEVTQGKGTAKRTVELLAGVCRRLGKRPVLVRHDVPGFVGNRLQFAVLREALHLLEEGVATAEDIDAAMTAGPGLRYALLGPLRTADLGGLDVFCAISRYLFPKLSAAQRPPESLERLVRQGKLGTKTGAGFYRYPKGERERIFAVRDAVLPGFLKVLRENGGIQRL